jgi:hypothetical protein
MCAEVETFDRLASASPVKGLRIAKVRCKKKSSSTDRSEPERRFRLPRPALPPRRSTELLSVLPHDRGRGSEPNADATPVINIGALGGYAPDDILGGQY